MSWRSLQASTPTLLDRVRVAGERHPQFCRAHQGQGQTVEFGLGDDVSLRVQRIDFGTGKFEETLLYVAIAYFVASIFSRQVSVSTGRN